MSSGPSAYVKWSLHFKVTVAIECRDITLYLKETKYHFLKPSQENKYLYINNFWVSQSKLTK